MQKKTFGVFKRFQPLLRYFGARVPHPFERAARGDEGERRGDGLPRDAESLVGDLEGQGSVGDPEEIFHPQVGFQAGFELLHKRSVVRQLAVLVAALDIPDVSAHLREVRLCHWNHATVLLASALSNSRR